MDVPLNAEVKCADGTCGRSTCIVMNPVHKEITHVVVEINGLTGIEYLVPVDQISSSTPQQIELRCTHEELGNMKPFVRSQFIGPEDSDYRYYLPTALEREASNGFLWPYSMPEDYGAYIGVEQIPHDQLGIHRGARVEATDGRVGRVNEFTINPENNYISHLVMHQRHLLGQKDIAIPVSAISRIEDDTVYLNVDKQTLKEMPDLPLRRAKG